jgi:hypothetical protein
MPKVSEVRKQRASQSFGVSWWKNNLFFVCGARVLEKKITFETTSHFPVNAPEN